MKNGKNESESFDELSQYAVIPYEDEADLVHTFENGFKCGDPTCYCMQDDGEQPGFVAEHLDVKGQLN